MSHQFKLGQKVKKTMGVRISGMTVIPDFYDKSTAHMQHQSEYVPVRHTNGTKEKFHMNHLALEESIIDEVSPEIAHSILTKLGGHGKDFFELPHGSVADLDDHRRMAKYSGKNDLGRSQNRQFYYHLQKQAAKHAPANESRETGREFPTNYTPAKPINASLREAIERVLKESINEAKADPWKRHEELEDENDHSGDMLHIAKHVGDKDDIKKAQDILARHRKEGYLSTINGYDRSELSKKLWPRFHKAFAPK